MICVPYWTVSDRIAALFAAMHPDRVLALVLYNSFARGSWAPDYPIGISEGRPHEEWRAELEERWGTDEMAKWWIEEGAPSHVGDPDWVRWLAKAMRHGASPAAALAFNEVEAEMDVRSVLATVQA